MADYYSILKRTISGLGQNSEAMRGAVFTRARAAIDRQLRAMDPTPSEDAIARQMQMLEEAIVKIESENGGSISEENIMQTTPLDVAPVAPTVDVTRATVVSSEPVIDPGVAPRSTDRETTSAISTGGELHHAPNVQDPRGMDFNDTILAEEPAVSRHNGEKAKGGFLSAMLPLVLGIAVVGGGIYALWINKDALLEEFLSDSSKPVIEETQSQGSQLESQPDENTQTQAAQSSDNTTSQPKGNIRVVGSDPIKKTESQLTPLGTTVEPVDSSPTVEPTNDPVNEPVADSNASTEVADPQQPQIEAAEPQVTEIAPSGSDPTNESATSPATSSSNTIETGAQVAQSAFLYEEGSSGANASRDNAAIIWSLGKVAGKDGVEEAVIKGKLDIPSRGINMVLSLKRNHDDSLPASHIIEIQFTVPPEFTGGNISSVARFVMKSSEQARGEGLVAVPAKINDGYFLIALNNLEQALQTNRKLLLESSWIDIPLGYTTGRRALITLEKGALGNKVFQDAFSDWDAR